MHSNQRLQESSTDSKRCEQSLIMMCACYLASAQRTEDLAAKFVFCDDSRLMHCSKWNYSQIVGGLMLFVYINWSTYKLVLFIGIPRSYINSSNWNSCIMIQLCRLRTACSVMNKWMSKWPLDCREVFLTEIVRTILQGL